MKKLIYFFLLTAFSVSVKAQSTSASISTAWGNYVSTNISAYGNMLIQVTMYGQNFVWHGLFSLQSTNSYTPNATWNNAKLISYSGYNTGGDDVQALIMSNSSTSAFGATYIVIKTTTPVNGSASMTVTATGAGSSSLSLSSSSSAPYSYTMANSAGTSNTWTSNGNVGIGTINPQHTLHSVSQGNSAAASSFFYGQYYGTAIGTESTSSSYYAFNVVTGTNSAGSGGTSRFYVRADGNVGIGTTTPQAKLAVNGDIFSQKVKVTQTGWPDYVFHHTYKLRPLKDLEAYIKVNNHLPEVPSAQEVEKNGLDLGDNQATFLKKIEELTMYMIDLNKKVDKLTKENTTLKKKVATIKTKQ